MNCSVGVAPLPDWVARPDWIRAEGVRGFAGQPLLFRGEVLGVLAVFTRGAIGSECMGYNSTRFAGAIAADEHARRDPEVRHQLGEIASELLAVRFTGYRTLTALQRGQIPGPEAGLAVLRLTE